jgi:biotin carboxyl carrier protein
MKFDVEINGRARSVTIEPAGARSQGRFHVDVDGLSAEVTAAVTDLGLALLFADGRSLDVALSDRRGEWLVQLSHASMTARVNGRRYQRDDAAAVNLAGPQRVVAPMPGRVVRVLVKPGEDVAERQGLVVVEAMKMENELGAPKAGRVREVAVTEGASVEAGRLLVVVE